MAKKKAAPKEFVRRKSAEKRKLNRKKVSHQINRKKVRRGQTVKTRVCAYQRIAGDYEEAEFIECESDFETVFQAVAALIIGSDGKRRSITIEEFIE